MAEPNYMHSFAITDNYFIIIEQPLTVRLKKIIACFVSGKPLSTTLKWRQTQVRVIPVIFLSLFVKIIDELPSI